MAGGAEDGRRAEVGDLRADRSRGYAREIEARERWGDERPLHERQTENAMRSVMTEMTAFLFRRRPTVSIDHETAGSRADYERVAGDGRQRRIDLDGTCSEGCFRGEIEENGDRRQPCRDLPPQSAARPKARMAARGRQPMVLARRGGRGESPSGPRGRPWRCRFSPVSVMLEADLDPLPLRAPPRPDEIAKIVIG